MCMKLNPAWTFETFADTYEDDLPASMARIATVPPCRSLNPLFIHGPERSGKSHLLHAVGNRLRLLEPDWRFALFEGRGSLPREWRSDVAERCDVLLLDDAHVMLGEAAAPASVDALLRLIVRMRERSRPVVLTSLLPPDRLPRIELTARFGEPFGIAVDMAAMKRRQETRQDGRMWDAMLAYIKGQLSRPSYTTWFEGAKAEWGADGLTIIAQNTFAKEWLESRYGALIDRAAEAAGAKEAGKPLTVRFAVSSVHSGR